jgi:hypothetical protein
VDPAFQVNPEPDPGFWWPKTEEEKNKRWTIFLIKNCNLLMSKLQEKPSSLKREHTALQKMKFIYFFLCLWVIFALLDPDRESRSGFWGFIEFGSNPEHWNIGTQSTYRV